MLYFIIGFRNILKNMRKNLLTILMISFGMTALFIYSGSNTQMFKQFREMVIHDQYGSFQLHLKGYGEFSKKYPYDYLIENYSVLEKKLLQDTEIDYLAPRLHFSGIMAGDEKSIIIKGFGGIAESEAKMQFGKVNTGTFITSEASAQAIVGELALKRAASVLGDKLTVLLSMKGGGVSAVDFRITGTKKSYGESDIENQMFILAGLKDVQSLIWMDDTVDTIIVHLKNKRSFSNEQKRIAIFCENNGLEYKKWNDLAIFYERSRQVFMMNQNILTVIILIISIFIIINTMFMTYMERVREIGTIRAIGTSKYQVGFIFIFESIVLSSAGGLLGIGIASIIGFFINIFGGIYHPVSVFNESPFYTLIKPEAITIVFYFLLFICVSIFASILISIKAWKLSIAESFRWY